MSVPPPPPPPSHATLAAFHRCRRPWLCSDTTYHIQIPTHYSSSSPPYRTPASKEPALSLSHHRPLKQRVPITDHHHCTPPCAINTVAHHKNQKRFEICLGQWGFCARPRAQLIETSSSGTYRHGPLLLSERLPRMSSDTAKENASVVDSSVTEWKHDVEYLDGQESPSYKGNDDAYLNGAEVQGYGHDRLGNSCTIKSDKLYGTRYFVIKSLSHQNIQLSIEKGIWATQVMNEPILEEAFHNSGKVILIFSVNMSGFFQGYAQMMSSVGWRRDNVWSQGSSGKNRWGRSFKVKWLQLNDLPFQKTLHLKNPLNDYKPVKISRDCQELPQDIGAALCELLDGKDDADANLKRDDLPSKRLCIEPPCAVLDEECHMPAVHMAWDQSHQTPMFYPTILFQHQAEARRFNSVHLPITSAASKVTQTKHSQINGSLTSMQLDHDNSSRFDVGGWSAERSPLASTLTMDDILEMSYEEYLEVHSRGNKQLFHPAARPSQRILGSTSKEHGDDSAA
ncbi:hypothetical protein U1Q18_019488 [Sarracenia purpurea var. burkii]